MDRYANHTRDRNWLLLFYFLFYYVLLISFLHDGRLLAQYRPVFFNENRDLTELLLIATGLPRWMIAHSWTFALADCLAFLLPIPLLWQGLRLNRFSIVPGIVFVIYFSLYLLLDDIFWQVHHEPFILFLLLALCWTTRKPGTFYLLLNGCRVYFLYIFVSAAIWKIARGAVFSPQEMSRILLFHHTDLLTGSCDSAACRGYRWLIGHPSFSFLLYLAGTALEASFVIGFFTRRRDRLLIGLAIVFVVADLLVMRIPYWMMLIGSFPLWLRRVPRTREKRILIYETTHHENLPALLDLCEGQFTQVTVFLKELSYHHLTGEGSPEQRWPGVEFFVQTGVCSNRKFLSQLFSYVRRHGYTHVHFATLDNNLLLIALRLNLLDAVHVSVTVHEINEYTTPAWHGIRDWTETLAKFLLHRRIRHHHVFLPAMAGMLGRRLPGSTNVFIPSRFYSLHRPREAPAAAPPYRIVVPGSLDPNRRNYSDLGPVFSILLAEPATPAICLVLLGDGSTDRAAAVLSSLASLTSSRFTVVRFSGYIPEAKYETELASAHLLWSPLNIRKKGSRGHTETYGHTTASGLTADLLLNDVPALVPADFIVPDPFRPAIHLYDSPAAAAECIRNMLFDPAAYSLAREEIRQAFAFFSKENFAAAFDLLITPA